MLKHASTYLGYIIKKIRKGHLMMIMRFSFLIFFMKAYNYCEYSFELHRLVDAIQMSTHKICLYKKVDKKYTGCNLKTTKLLDRALIGVCAVIRSNTVFPRPVCISHRQFAYLFAYDKDYLVYY